MTDVWKFPVDIRRKGGEYHAYSTDLPEAIASGSTRAAALDEMAKAIAAAVRGRIKDAMDLPAPLHREAKTGAYVTLPARLAAKASIYAAWRSARISKTELARRMDQEESEIRRILNPDHGTKLDQLEEAARVLGGRLVIGFEPA